jgi:hypothetical protein
MEIKNRIHDVDYDLEAALEYNPDPDDPLKASDILGEHAVIYGENDGYAWHWLVELKDGRFAYITGDCDYTGWDCSSSASWQFAETLQDALSLVPTVEEYTGRRLREQLANQLNNIQPFGTYKVVNCKKKENNNA